MSQAQTPVNPNPNPYPNPNKYRAPSSTPNAPPASEAHLNPDLAAPPARATVAADNSDPTATVVASTTTTAAGTLKRPREEDAEAGTSTDVPEAKRRVKATHDVLYRIVVPSKQIGKVIGRSGHRIQKIREDTKATIKIADAISVSRLISFPLF